MYTVPVTNEPTPAWKLYERLVTAFEVESAAMDSSVTPNALLLGSISGVQRQIDVLIEARWEEDLARRIIFDAKRRSRKVTVKDVESFEGMMRDVGATRGVIVCTRGYTKAASKRAQELIDIRLVDEDEALEEDYAAVDPCPHCAVLKRKTRGVVFWDGQFPMAGDAGWAIIFTGKCDVCRNFAFWCWECGEKAVVPEGEPHECGCERKWFTERSGDEVIFVVSTEEGEVPLDRRSLR
jgi:hypothetical protein